MAFWAYLLRCADGSYYAGHTDNLEHRIGQHSIGRGSDYTARRQPVSLAWSEAFPSRLEALTAERQIKGWSRAKKEALVAGDWVRMHELALSREARASTALSTNGLGVQTAVSAVRPEPEGRASRADPPEATP